MKPDLNAIRARAEAATKGKWEEDGDAEWCSEGEYGTEWVDSKNWRIIIPHDNTGSGRCQACADAKFIAHSLQDNLDLLAYVEELEKDNHQRKT